ncbi:helix-turn-helix domain-containing protein [Modestobacter sp. L9-4]|uniref:helix-turn-helix domain-containing protein n=1 Tax=Modestobacter sp. L9-4 TaxID=2851567 RepID=UPI001C7688D1|nr:helix-turn-helix transcriptional regulator [Modestobacter sp. L9-4]QXG76382.1 helix-turn-helix domain-containing protein [Modestobacter sp. L9-4]
MSVIETPSVRERRLAAELRVLRTAAQLHGKDVAAALGWSPSKVSRIETGRSGVSGADLERLVQLYGVPEPQAGLLRRLAPSARPRGWWDAYAETLSPGYANLIRMESGSRALRCYGALVPHALLQTPDFAREVILSTWERPSPAEVERRVQVCRRRQEVLDADRDGGAVTLSAVLDESVLRRCVVPGDPARDTEVRRGQLRRLVEVAARPGVRLQVLPFSAGLPPVTAGSFSVLDSLATATADAVYLENKTRIFFLDAEAEVHRYTQAFDLISRMALDPADSVALIETELAALPG